MKDRDDVESGRDRPGGRLPRAGRRSHPRRFPNRSRSPIARPPARSSDEAERILHLRGEYLRLCAWSNRVDELFAWLRSHDLTSRTRLQQIEALRYREESAWTKLAILARSVAPETWQVRRTDADRAMRELEEAWRCVAPRLALEEGWDEGRWL